MENQDNRNDEVHDVFGNKVINYLPPPRSGSEGRAHSERNEAIVRFLAV